MAKKKQIKKIDDHFFFSLKKTRKELGRNQELGLGKSSLQKTILFFSNIFFFFFWFYLTYHHNFLCFIIILSGLVFLRFVKDLSYKKEKNSWIKKYITA